MPAHRRRAPHRRRWTGRTLLTTLTGAALIAGIFVAPTPATAVEAPVNLGTAGTYSLLAGTSIANTGPSTYSGDIGTSPGTTVSGFPPGIVTGEIHPGDAAAAQARVDLQNAYNDASTRASTASIAGDLAGRTLTAGVYKATAAVSVSTTLTLDAQGDPDAIFIFQIDAAFDVAAGSEIRLRGGARPANVIWQVVGAVALGATASFTGTIMGLAAIAVGAGTTVTGRALTLNGAIALSGNVFTTEPTVNLASAAAYSILAGASVANSGGTTLSGDLGTSPGTTVTGFPPGVVSGTIHAGDASAAQARTDLQTAIADAAGRVPTATLAGNLSGRTLTEGVYRASGVLGLGTELVLDGEGNRNGVFIFQLEAGLTTSAGSVVRLVNGAQAARIIWQVAGTATLGGASTFMGTILGQSGISIGNSTGFTGRALTLGDTVTLNTNVFITAQPLGLGSAGTYAVLATTSVASTGISTIGGDIGVSPGTAITGFPPGTLSGSLHPGDSHAAAAQADLQLAYNDAASRTPTATLAGDLAGRTLTAGIYRAGAALSNSTTLTLDGQGNPNAVFIFQIEAAFAAAAGSSVLLVNGADASRVFWQVVGAVSLGATASFSGTLLTLAAISVGADATFTGRALTLGGAVALSNNVFTNPTPVAGPLTATTSGATLSGVVLQGIETQYSTGTSEQWVIVDDRGTGAAWTLSVSASVPTSAAGTVETVARTLPAEGLVITPGTITAGADGGPIDGISAPALALSETAQTLITTSGPNRGSYLLSPSFSLAIPPNAYRSNFTGAVDGSPLNPYVSVLTFTIS